MYQQKVIFSDANLDVHEYKKIGVIGRNGAGKSTLFNIIVGEEEVDGGEVHKYDILRLGYLKQQEVFLGEETALTFLERRTEKPIWECAQMLGKFDIRGELLEQPLIALSGGYQMRVKLAEMFLCDPNLLLLDEPTNYLDVNTQLLLEQVLRSYRGAFLIISHDREFLKNTCLETLEVERGEIVLYPGPLEEYLAFKEDQQVMKIRYNKKIQREQRHLQTFVDRFRYKASKATQAQSKLKQLNRLHTIEITHPLSAVFMQIPPAAEKKGGLALRVKDLCIGYAQKRIAEHVILDVARGSHVAIVGENGHGKTTLLKTLAGKMIPLAGAFQWAPNSTIGYYAQHVAAELDQREQVWQHLKKSAGIEMNDQEILKMAGNFLFKEDDLLKPISLLSGGEKARLSLSGILLQKNNVLLLDEPTNHLDFETVEALARALKEFNGTVLFVSHNRTFVNMLAESIIEVKNGLVRFFGHSYEDYVRQLALLQRDEVDFNTTSSERKELPDEKKLRKQEIRRLEKELKKIEETISLLTTEKDSLLATFQTDPTNYSRELNEKIGQVFKDIGVSEEEWLRIQEKLDKLK